MIGLISPFLIAFILTACFSYGVLKFFPAWGIMDRPDRYGHDREPVPYPGGVALFLGIVISLLLWVPISPPVLAILFGGTLLAGVSFLDDRFGLPPLIRLCVQLLSALILIFGGLSIATLTLPFFGALPLDAIELPVKVLGTEHLIVVFADLLTVIWVMIMVNAFNWTDGVPGFSASVALVLALILFLLSMRSGFHSVDQSLAIQLSLIVAGASAAFLLFNFPPAKMLMGDTGSMLLGFLLAAAAIASGAKIATTVLVLSFPLLDFVWVIARRLLVGQSPFKGDLLHLHHRLLRVGLSERGTVVFFVATSTMFGILALLLETVGKVLLFGLISLFMVLLASLLYIKK